MKERAIKSAWKQKNPAGSSQWIIGIVSVNL